MPEFEVDSPFIASLGARIAVWRAGYVEFIMPIQPAHLNRQGVLQGGVIATLLDAACGYAGVFADVGQPVRHGFTLSLTVNYLDTALGRDVVAKGFLERSGKTIFFSRGEAWVDDRVLVASAQGTFKYSSGRAKK